MQSDVSKGNLLSVEYIDHMGSDLSVVNAARVSFHKESDWEDNVIEVLPGEKVTFRQLSSRDKKLINYLARNGHWTPFGHTAITVRVKAPVFVRTQCFKHKVGFVENEVSRRYVTEGPEFFVPETWRSAPEDAKQGSGGEIKEFRDGYGKYHNSPQFEFRTAADISYHDWCELTAEFYRKMIREGVAPEQARMILPQSMYTEWYWTGSLMSFARFYNLRSDSHAQKEIQEIAHMIEEVVRPLFPVSWEALTNDRDTEKES